MSEAAGTLLPSSGLIHVRGARVHNLQNVHVEIPRQRLTVVTGVSGSGKSSLAFDVLHAESQRRFLESLSSETRARVATWQRPDVDVIDGLPPTIAVGQRSATASLRSTLASTTEILDYLRLLFARCGQAHCPQCGRELAARTTQEIVDQILRMEEGRKVMLLAPRVRSQRGQHREEFESIAKAGFVRARVDGQIVEAACPPALPKSQPHSIDAVVDRIVVKAGLQARLRESIELALKHGDGTVVLSEQVGDGWRDRAYSSRFACAECRISFAELEPRTLSFNSPHGACLSCRGLGVIAAEDADPAEITERQSEQRELCSDCAGTRLNSFARAVRFRGRTLPEMLRLTVSQCTAIVSDWQSAESQAVDLVTARVLERTLPAIRGRLEFLIRVGADYLTLDRPARSLSGGEFQRARLAACLGSGLVGACYVLDEPTVGLHPKDTAAMIATLHELRDQGNTVLVVEHDPDVMRQADHLIELGPGAGADGGRLIASGSPDEVASNPASMTGPLIARKHLPNPEQDSVPSLPQQTTQHGLTLSNVSVHNLHNLSVRIPLHALTAITGVSGSGKTSLVHHALVPYVREQLARQTAASEFPLARLVEITQAPLGRSATSNAATYSGLWDDVCHLFAQLRESKLRGFRADRFRFNSASGRCPECRGRGEQRIRLKLMPEVFVTCPACRGDRFNAATLQIRFRGLTVADVLRLRVEEARDLFANVPRIAAVLGTFQDVGLGYLRLGQPAATLSGGEAQRVKLATELSRVGSAPTLFVLDEPTTGLHPLDVEKLLTLLRRLVSAGHSVVVIEHHLDVIARADWMIDLGPGGGVRGGQIVAEGTPRDVAARGIGHTAQALAAHGTGSSGNPEH
jgi:excinuclease ABC subunit A